MIFNQCAHNAPVKSGVHEYPFLLMPPGDEIPSRLSLGIGGPSDQHAVAGIEQVRQSAGIVHMHLDVTSLFRCGDVYDPQESVGPCDENGFGIGFDL